MLCIQTHLPSEAEGGSEAEGLVQGHLKQEVGLKQKVGLYTLNVCCGRLTLSHRSGPSEAEGGSAQHVEGSTCNGFQRSNQYPKGHPG